MSQRPKAAKTATVSKKKIGDSHQKTHAKAPWDERKWLESVMMFGAVRLGTRRG